MTESIENHSSESTNFEELALATKASVENAEASIKTAREVKWKAERAAELQYYADTKESTVLLDNLQTTYQEAAQELAEVAHSCPKSPWGTPLDASDVYVTAEGIVLSWDINGDYAPATFKAPWAELLAHVAAQSAQPNDD